MNRKNDGSGIIATVIVVGIFFFIGFIIDACTPKCIESGCDNDRANGSSYCYLHKNYTGSSSYKYRKSTYKSERSTTKSYTTSVKPSETRNTSTTTKAYNSSNKKHNSYDEGYEDVYENDDYDMDRYYSDDSYADGVDDAMDELGW